MNKKDIIISFILIGFFCYLLTAQDIQVEKDAIDRCGGADKIVLKYTSTGDKYYMCNNNGNK